MSGLPASELALNLAGQLGGATAGLVGFDLTSVRTNNALAPKAPYLISLTLSNFLVKLFKFSMSD